METQETYSTQEPEPLPPMVQGVKAEIISLARNINGHNWPAMLAEIGRIADWWLAELSEEENDGNSAE